MSTNSDQSASHLESLSTHHNATYNWDYDNSRTRLARLYENAKRDQWNSTDVLDWSMDVDPR